MLTEGVMVLTVTSCCPVISHLNMSITACSISLVMNTGCMAPAQMRCTHADENAQSSLPVCNPHNGNHSSSAQSLHPAHCTASTLFPHGHGRSAHAGFPTHAKPKNMIRFPVSALAGSCRLVSRLA